MSNYQSIDTVESSKSAFGDDSASIDPEKSHLLKPHSSKTEEEPNRCLLSIYVLLATLFFGFAAGFSVGFYIFGTYSGDGSSSPVTFLNPTNKLQSLFFPDSTSSTPSRNLLYLNRGDAYELLLDSMSLGSATISTFSNDFFQIASGLDVQVNQDYCSVATVVAILNSLRYLRNGNSINIPIDPAYAPFSYATQEDIFNECTKKTVISHTGGGIGVDGIMSPPFGLNMGQVAQLLRCHLDSAQVSWNVETHYVDRTHMTVGKVKFDLRNALQDTSSRILVNYDRTGVGQAGGGHWSPIGSYSEKWDAFLILDVAKYKYPPVWVPTERLFAAMATYDNCGSWNYPDAQEKLSVEERNGTTTAEVYSKLGCRKALRGYIIVTKNTR